MFRPFMLKANWIKTIAFNFRMLPFEQAIHLPILLFGKVDISNCEGCVKLAPPHDRRANSFGQVIIGNQFSVWGYNHPTKVTTLRILGTLELKGRFMMAEGSSLYVATNAVMHIEKNVFIFNDVKLACNERIDIGENTRVAWECQIYDTSFHYVVDDEGVTKRINTQLSIGKNCWIGNRSTLSKGTQLADWCIVASNSLVNKDFSAVPRCLIAGSPAKIIRQGLRRVHNTVTERKISVYFDSHPDETSFQVSENEIEMKYRE